MVLLKPSLYQNQSRTILKLLDKNLVDVSYVDFQFIERSVLPTLHFQPALPRLPIPDLKNTCDRYLAAQRPLLIEESFRKTEANVRHFRDGVGRELQKLLKLYDSSHKHTSYISELWFDKYLRDRTPLPLNYNPMLVLHNDERGAYNTQLVRTTNLIVSSLRFFKALRADLLEPDVFHLNPKSSDTPQLKKIWNLLPSKLAYVTAYFYKAFPLDMSQYPNLFQTTRIPEIDKDRLINCGDAKHITVQHKGNFYVVDVLSVSNDIVNPEEIMATIQQILNDDQPAAEFPVGLFTTLERNKWATIRHELAENGNDNTLKVIDSAIFNLCLDDESTENEPKRVTHQFLHADGTNRWFDKSFSLIVAKDGVAGINFEHSWGDGVAVLRYGQDIYKDSLSNPRVHPDTKPKPADAPLRRLPFNLTDSLKNAIKEARERYAKIGANLDVNYTVFEGIGKTICKKNRVSPDAVMQLAFQVAYHQIKGTFVPTYESCSTAAFKHGRTETIRPLTSDVRDLAVAINSKSRPGMGELKRKIFECSEAHNILIKNAAMGQGFDRHLYALKCFGEKHDIKSNLFIDPEYSHINHNILSTSTLNSPAIFAGGFGPVVQEGYGIGYVIKDEYLGVLATNYKDGADGPTFISALTKAFEDIFRILQSQ